MSVNGCRFRYPYEIEIISESTKRSIVWSVLGGSAIGIVFYAVHALGMRSLIAPLSFLSDRWYYVLPLIAGFAIQAYLLSAAFERGEGTRSPLIASGGFSTAVVASCCLHNLIPILPMIGVASAAAFFSSHQNHAFMLGIAFMVMSVWYTQRKIAVHEHDHETDDARQA